MMDSLPSELLIDIFFAICILATFLYLYSEMEKFRERTEKAFTKEALFQRDSIKDFLDLQERELHKYKSLIANMEVQIMSLERRLKTLEDAQKQG